MIEFPETQDPLTEKNRGLLLNFNTHLLKDGSKRYRL